MRRTPTTAGLLASLIISVSLGTAEGGEVLYCEAENAIWLKDFAEEAPADLTIVLDADRQNGWGKVRYDRATDTTVINASLWIGDDVTLGTFFQIGRKDHPSETVIVKGDVWVRPPKESTTRSDDRLSIVNRLRLGDPEDETIRATLRIACEQRQQYGVRIGFRDKETWISRGELHVFNSTITAAIADRDHMLKPWGWYGSDVQLVGATISWIDGTMTYGVQAHNGTIRRTTFEHGGAALRNGQQVARNCVFRNLETAVAEGGCLSATLIGCTFENNRRNWTLGGSSGVGVTMIDCDIKPQNEPIQLIKNRLSPEEAVRRRMPIYPTYTEWRMLEVKVVDPEGAMIPDAIVTVDCTEDPDAVQNGLTLTDATGLTPADSTGGAVLITRKRLQATDDPEKPTEFDFTYNVSVHKRDYETKRILLKSNEQIPRPLVVELGRHGAAGL